jgi:hypothetical protein
MSTPHDLEAEFTLLTAAVRYNELSVRHALAPSPDATVDQGEDGPHPDVPSLTREEALELLALGEVIARKASYGRQLVVRSARAAGASWSQIGAALGTSKQSAWEAHARWIDEQAEIHRQDGYGGLDSNDAHAARTLAGPPDDQGGA